MNAPWIKICGLRDAGAVAQCLALEVDAIGFVFAPSVRQISLVDALRLADSVRGRAQVVAVLRGISLDLSAIIKDFDPDYLQIDYDVATLPGFTEARSTLLPRNWLPVLHEGERVPEVLPPFMLYESRESGSGKVANWQEAAALSSQTRLVLAGGLTPDNVRDAIEKVRPFGVDVSSGVERERGVKCPLKIKDFVMAARTASRV